MIDKADGNYTIEVFLEGGTGRAQILSPAKLQVEDQRAKVRLEWNSSSYDYMIMDEEMYYPISTDPNSVFELPVPAFDEKIEVLADTTAMSVPHEIAYTIELDRSSIKKEKNGRTSSFFGTSLLLFLILLVGVFMWGCRGRGKETKNGEISKELQYESSMELKYASCFQADYYSNGFVLLTMMDGNRLLLNTEQKPVPEDLIPGIKVLEGRADRVYLAASAVMDMFRSIDATDNIILSGIREDNWYIEDAAEAMKTGKILYAGKYNTPDYELMLTSGCRLAVESTMINHVPEVKEKLESFGIPVLVDFSSYEEHPLGRMEWVKLYGVLTGNEKEAAEAFDRQVSYYTALGEIEKQDKTVVFFYITSNGTVVVRKAGDYVSKMIELAGGTYLFDNPGEDDKASSSINMQMEEFYTKAKEADYLVYNSTVEGDAVSLQGLIQKAPLLKDFKAIQEGNVWCTTQNVYQESMSTGKMIEEFHHMLADKEVNNEKERYLFPMQ